MAVQGCGHVGYFLAEELARVGAKLVVADVDPAKVKRVVDDHGATSIPPEEIYSINADIFAPCALGGVLNDQTIPQLKAKLVAGRGQQRVAGATPWRCTGAARRAVRAGLRRQCRWRNQWLLPRDAGWDVPKTLAKTDAIYDTLLTIFAAAEREKIATYQAADRLAEERFMAKG